MDYEKIIEELVEVFEIDDIQLEDQFRDYDTWDSLTLLSLTAMINDEFGITIPRNEFEKLETINELYEYVLKSIS